MNTKRILIVDDDMPLAQSLKLNLEDTGLFEVWIENHPSRALATARAFSPELILLDYIMPGMDGGDVSSQLHQDPYLSHVPVIMITALISNSETGDSGVVYRNGHYMVAKPIKFDNLLQCIETSLKSVAVA